MSAGLQDRISAANFLKQGDPRQRATCSKHWGKDPVEEVLFNDHYMWNAFKYELDPRRVSQSSLPEVLLEEALPVQSPAPEVLPLQPDSAASSCYPSPGLGERVMEDTLQKFFRWTTLSASVSFLADPVEPVQRLNVPLRTGPHLGVSKNSNP